jgi:hypothetical protein
MLINTYHKSKKKKITKKQLQEQQDFKSSINAIPLPSGGKYLSSKAKIQKKSVFTYRVPRDIVRAESISDTVKGAMTKTGIMKDYHKLPLGDREIVDYVATCTAPLHKGNYTYVTEGMNPASFGRKNEVL